MWTRYDVEWKFVTRLCGSLPADPELQRKWLESRKPKVRPPDSRSIDEIAAEVAASTADVTEDDEKGGLYVFQRFEGGLVMRMATVRAHIKDCARVLSSLYVGKIEKEKSFAVKVINSVYYPKEVYWVPVLSQDNGEQVKAPSGQTDKPIHPQGRQGQISAIKTYQYVEGAMMRFQLDILTQPSGRQVISEDDLRTIMDYGGTHGYGGERSDGEGRYEYTLTKVVEK